MAILTLDTPKSEPSVEFLLEPLGTRDPAGVLSRVALVEELAWCHVASRPLGRLRSSADGGQDHRVLWVHECANRRYVCQPSHGQRKRRMDRSGYGHWLP